jgi:hypothetical protein
LPWRENKKAATGLSASVAAFLGITNFRPDCDWVESLEEKRKSNSAARCHVADLGLSEKLVLPTES